MLDRAVTRILNIVLRACDLARTPAVFDRAADHALAVDLARESAVLVQNLGALPLHPGRKVAYIGAFAETPRYQGGGSSHVNTHAAVGALAVARAKGRKVSYVEGFPTDRDQRDEDEFLRAVNLAEEADVAVIFAGLPEIFESEGADRRHMRLPDCQNNLIARVAAVQKNTVVVLHTGAPVECPWAGDVSAVLCMYLAGVGGGPAGYTNSEAAKWHAYFSAKTVICPTNPDQAINSTLYWKSYGMRYYGDNFSDEEGKYAYESVNGWPMGGFITTRVKNPSAVFYLGDTASIGTAVSHGGFGWRRSVDYETRKIRIMTRHSGKANMGFFDGHVAARSFNEMKNSPVKLNICYGL